MLLPSVELSSSWGNEPGEGFHAGNDYPKSECDSDVTPHISAKLGTSNDKSNENPKCKYPGEWDNPGNSSEVDFLHDSVFALFNISKEPEKSKDVHSASESILHNGESMPFTISEAPDTDVIVTRVAWVPCVENYEGNCTQEPPNKPKPYSL